MTKYRKSGKRSSNDQNVIEKVHDTAILLDVQKSL